MEIVGRSHSCLMHLIFHRLLYIFVQHSVSSWYEGINPTFPGKILLNLSWTHLGENCSVYFTEFYGFFSYGSVLFYSTGPRRREKNIMTWTMRWDIIRWDGLIQGSIRDRLLRALALSWRVFSFLLAILSSFQWYFSSFNELLYIFLNIGLRGLYFWSADSKDTNHYVSHFTMIIKIATSTE